MDCLYKESGQLVDIVNNPESLRTYLQILAMNPNYSIEDIANIVLYSNQECELPSYNQSDKQWSALKTLINGNICPIVISNELPEAVSAVYMSERKSILLNCNHSMQEILWGLIRETAYASLDNNGQNFSRQNNAFYAYAISYVVACRLGIPYELFTYDVPPKAITAHGEDSARKFFDLIKTKVHSMCIAEKDVKGLKHRNDCR